MEPDPSCELVRECHSLVLILFTTWVSVKKWNQVAEGRQ